MEDVISLKEQFTQKAKVLTGNGCRFCRLRRCKEVSRWIKNKFSLQIKIDSTSWHLTGIVHLKKNIHLLCPSFLQGWSRQNNFTFLDSGWTVPLSAQSTILSFCDYFFYCQRITFSTTPPPIIHKHCGMTQWYKSPFIPTTIIWTAQTHNNWR